MYQCITYTVPMDNIGFQIDYLIFKNWIIIRTIYCTICLYIYNVKYIYYT